MKGVFGKYNRDGIFIEKKLEKLGLSPFETLIPSETLIPNDTGFVFTGNDYSKFWYDEYVINAINRIVVVGELVKTFSIRSEFENSYVGNYIYDIRNDKYGTANNNNTYYMNNNIIFNDFILPSDITTSTDYNFNELVYITLSKMLTNIGEFKMIPLDATLIGLPFLECGNNVLLQTSNGDVETYIMKRTLSGVNSLSDSIDTKFSETNELINN